MAEILFVDDEPHILKALKRTFHKFHDWQFFFANSPKEAIEIISKNQIDVLVSDHKMPIMEGAEFLCKIKDKRPNIIRIMLTGHANLPAVEEAVNNGQVFKFILKPWDDDVLKQVIEQAVEFKNKQSDEKKKIQISKKLQDTNQELQQKVQHRSGQLSDALHTAQTLHDSLNNALQNSSKVFFSIIELTRPQLGTHSRQVAKHAVGIGTNMGFTANELAELEIAALLHDIGKVGFPLFMMEKNPIDYNREELEIYHTHPIVGADSLKSISQYEKICKYIKAHHERFNKSGFPYKLKPSEIPTEAYIIGIADEIEYLLNFNHFDKNYINQYTFQKIADKSDKEFPTEITEVALDYIESLKVKTPSSNEHRVGLGDLRPNLKLSRDLYTMSGLLLLTKDSVLTIQSIVRIRSIARVDSIAGDIYVQESNEKKVLQRET